MRLTEKKVDYLCHKLYNELRSSPTIVWDRAEGPAVEVIKKIFLDDLRAEEELDAEVTRILEERRDDMRRFGADYHTMFKKTKSLLARERKIIV